MRRPFRSLLLMFALVSALSMSLLAGTPASAATSLEWAMLTKVNADRTAHGLRALPLRSSLTYYAHKHSVAMASRRALYHSDLRKICCFVAIAENVGVGSSLSGIHTAFMNSSGHRANILNRRWEGVGVGVVSSGGRLWVTEIFRDPS
jgi:uncharacterized protein YkwD